MRYLALVTRMRLDADGMLDKDNRDHDRRWFACDQTFGGVFVLRGELDAEGGAILKTAIDALCLPTGPDDRRIGSQRRADALVDLASRQLQDGSLGSTHGQRPHLTLTASIETLRAVPDAAAAELTAIGPVHAQTARRLACDAVCTTVTIAAQANDSEITGCLQQHKPLSVGRDTRVIPSHIRTALHVRDRGCRLPGCDRPPQWTDGHHIQHWADDGRTELSNLLSMCRRHHRFVHEKGWHVRVDEQNNAVITPPP